MGPQAVAERRAQVDGIAQRLQAAARGVKHQHRAPQPGIAEAAQREPCGEEDNSDRIIRLRISRAQVAPI